ncbi:MAG: SRPBCC family protein [Alphaproteobacteria bacterium]|nr:SRPBCC family protein [Alphaproteobacteria bacterium]
MSNIEQIYTTYIRSTEQKVWDAITNPEFTRQYWGHENVSDWKIGSKWGHVANDDPTRTPKIIGKVLECNPPRRLVTSWASPNNLADESKVTYEIQQVEDMVRLIVTHNEFKAGSTMANGVSKGWPRVLSSMKSYLETGKGLNVFAGMEKSASCSATAA